MSLKTGGQKVVRGFMQTVKAIVGVIILLALGLGFIKWYPYIFSVKVDGVLQKVERVQLNVSLMQTTGNMSEAMNPQLFSFAVAIRTDNGEIVTASAEDRQWAAAQIGNCVTATYYPYPPWQLDKSGTYHNARLDRQYECPERASRVQLPPSQDLIQPEDNEANPRSTIETPSPAPAVPGY